MIYVTGDTHGDIIRFIENNMGDSSWTKDDFLIICGDFGFVFFDSEQEKQKLDYLESKPYTICFCDGNHENFPRLFSYPQEKWNGGNVHKLRKNVFHLMRGQIFLIDGKKLFTMGGAYSRDRYMRTLNETYWEEELPDDGEYREAVKNLEEHNNSVDVIITHTAPREIIYRMGRHPDEHDMELTGFLEWIMYEVKFDHWYFGHWHTDKTIDEKYTAAYYNTYSVL